MRRRCWRLLRAFIAGWFVFSLGASAAGAEMSVDDSIEAARDYDVVVVGEVHDNAEHHMVQADFAAALSPGALVFEMIRGRDAPGLMDVRAGGGDHAAQAEFLNWAESGWPDYSHYVGIMDAALDARIYGASLPRDEVRAAFDKGAAAIFGPGAARFGLTEALPADVQAAREELQFAAHCDAMPRELMGGMVEAQRLRDAALASAVVDALDADAGPVLVIAGNGHAHKTRGLPAVLATAAPDLRVFVFGQFEEGAPGDAAVDAWHITAAAEREDPCAVFRKG